MTYTDVYESWRADPEGFWLQAARAIDWHRFPSRALSQEAGPVPTWYPDGMVNGCHNALDRHVAEGRAHDVAIIHDSPVTETRSEITYADLLGRVARLAGALKARGVAKGDRVVIYMPMIPEAIEAMLACARIGAIHCVVFGGFAARELAVRIDDCRPKAILAASCGIEPNRVVAYKPLLDAALREADHKPDFCVILQRPQAMAGIEHGRDMEWHDFQEEAEPADCLPVEADHPAYILYTSGTTGKPKGVVRPTAGHLVALHWTMKNVYDTDPGEVFWAASDVGWVVGHSYICYGPLLHGNTTLIYEGKPVGTPDAGAFWRVIARNKVRSFFTAPTALRAIKREDPTGRLAREHDLSGLRAIFLAGERADPDTVAWARDVAGVPVYDHWWQTETGYAIAGNPVGIEKLPVKDGSATVPMPGYDVHILDEAGQDKPRGSLGAVAIRLPLPPGTLSGIWGDEDRFRRSYLSAYPGYYASGDAGMIDEDGYVSILARTDDVINVAGHRLSTGGMEEVLADHPDVAECAVIGVADPLKGQLPMGFLCLNRSCARPAQEIVREAVDLVRERVGPVAAFKLAVVVERLPKTRSGKILRATMAQIADGGDVAIPATIDDPAILDELRAAIAPLGYGARPAAVG
ncbi:AMP-binding protein [Limimaricola hongkongensis]|uniref:Acetyl-coenzyme A synthetase n=1 Tax=Limimaricola hongkongensis DSM 17492 TaxID=1122180 RepID=A0A017HER1_9RHOB|nr:AMP-binding protein [Limimaricola hongkongensis]EYD72284.1 Acetyl-coenzyme A synthetase [Limimaricola hongkongensis DSM 17492]